MRIRNSIAFKPDDGTGTVAPQGTEDSILDSVPGIDDGGGDAPTEITPETAPSGEPVQSPAGGTPPVASPDAGAGTGVATDVIGQQVAQFGQTGVTATKEGNLVDASGAIVAKAGAERRLYESAARFRGLAEQSGAELTRLRGELQTSQGQVSAFQQAASAATTAGLSAQESTVAVQLMASYKKNPIDTIKYMLTEAAAAGHNVSGISGGGMDASAVGRMLDEKLSPMLADRETAAQNAKARSDAQTEVATFFSQHPDARIHENVLAGIVNRNPTLSVREAYLTLQNYVLQQGLNWSQPLEPQIAAAQGGNGVAGAGQVGMPTGRGSGGATVPAGNTPVASEDASMDDIVRESMREAGMAVE